MIKNLSKIFVLLLLLSSCEYTYVYNLDDNRLPAFTQSGNNVAAAVVAKRIWEARLLCINQYASENNCKSAVELVYFNDKTLLILKGKLGNTDNAVYFEIDKKISNLSELADLTPFTVENTAMGTFDFMHSYTEEISDSVYYDFRIVYDTLRRSELTESSKGAFHLRNIELVERDSFNPYCIISGTFGFDTEKDGQAISYHRGRFDFRVRAHNINAALDSIGNDGLFIIR